MSIEELKQLNIDAEAAVKNEEIKSFEEEIARAKKNGIDVKKYEEELAKIKETSKKPEIGGVKEPEKDPSKKDEKSLESSEDKTAEAIKKAGDALNDKFDKMLEKLSTKEAETKEPAKPIYG